MDANSLALLNQLIQDRIARLSSSLPILVDVRGATLVDLIRGYVDGIDRNRTTLVAGMAGASEAERKILGRQLLRLRQHVDEVEGYLLPFVDDVQRRNLPVGLLHLVDALIGALLPNATDPVVHLADEYMYSTLGVESALAPVLTQLNVTRTWGPAPVVFNVPSLEARNAMLSPILAHEVGHQAVNQGNLGSETLKRADQAKLNSLLADCLGRANLTDASEWQVRLFRWMDELLCDALATIMMGPSFLFASCAFLPAPAEGFLGNHPFRGDRVRMTLAQLEALGWEELLVRLVPNVHAWAKSISAATPAPSNPQEEFLRNGVQILEDAILAVSLDHVQGALKVQEFSAVEAQLADLLTVGIPPAQVEFAPVSAWAILLSSWLYQMARLGDEPRTLARAISDAEFNGFALKAIEMARLSSFWNQR